MKPIKDATIRKIKNRGMTPVRYHQGGMHQQVRHGYLTGLETKKKFQLWLVPDERPRWLPLTEMRYIEEIGK